VEAADAKEKEIEEEPKPGIPEDANERAAEEEVTGSENKQSILQQEENH